MCFHFGEMAYFAGRRVKSQRIFLLLLLLYLFILFLFIFIVAAGFFAAVAIVLEQDWNSDGVQKAECIPASSKQSNEN